MGKIALKPAQPVKDYWFTRGLQQLSPEKFLKVVTKILDGEFVLLQFPNVRAFGSQSENRNGRLEIFGTKDGRMK